MIETEGQLTQARAALARFEDSLRALRARVYATNPELFFAMAEDYHENITAIRSEIDVYVGTEIFNNAEIPLWMTLNGETLTRREISSRLLAEWLGRFRKAVYGITAYLETGLVRVTGRPEAALLEATDPRVLALSPGSIKIGLRLPDATIQSDFFADNEIRPPAHRALEKLLRVASWAASGTINVPLELADDADELSVISRYAATLAPSHASSVRTVVFSGDLVPTENQVQLTVESRARLQGLVQMLSHVTVETVFGQVREIDLDARRVILRERGEGMPDLKCFIPEDQMGIVEHLLDRHVFVRGSISSATPDTVQVISIGEEAPE
jgi:hypothetical protein